MLQDQPAQNYVAQYNQVLGPAAGASTRASAACGASSRCATRPEVQPTDIAIRDVVALHARSTRRRQQSLNPNGRYQGNFTGSYFLDSASAGTHDLKAGLQLSWERVRVRAHPQRRRAARDCVTACRSRRSSSNTPINSDHRLNTWGVFFQDRWVARPGDDQRRPAHRRRERLPAGADERRRHLRRGAQLPEGRRVRLRSERRAAPRRLLRSVRQRQDGDEGLLRPLLQPVRVARSPRPPTRTRIVNQAVAWTDTNGNLAPRPRRAGHLHRLPARPVPDGGRRRHAALQPGIQRRRRAAARRQHGGVGAATIAASTATASASSTARAASTPTRRSSAPTSTRSAASRRRSPSTT